MKPQPPLSKIEIDALNELNVFFEYFRKTFSSYRKNYYASEEEILQRTDQSPSVPEDTHD